MIPPTLAGDIDSLIRKAHGPWLREVCEMLVTTPDSFDAFSVVARVPKTNNADAAHTLANILRRSGEGLTWKTLGTSIQICSSIHNRWSREQQIELLWTGPSPASQIPARRIDQVLYDLVASAGREILLVTSRHTKSHA